MVIMKSETEFLAFNLILCEAGFLFIVKFIRFVINSLLFTKLH